MLHSNMCANRQEIGMIQIKRHARYDTSRFAAHMLTPTGILTCSPASNESVMTGDAGCCCREAVLI